MNSRSALTPCPRRDSGSAQRRGASKRRPAVFAWRRRSDAICRSGTVFVGRVPLQPDEAHPPTEDLITSRILWLDGLDEHNANTRDRFVYIHGTKHEDKVGTPASHGCVRMRNEDVIELFEMVDEGAPVVIEA